MRAIARGQLRAGEQKGGVTPAVPGWRSLFRRETHNRAGRQGCGNGISILALAGPVRGLRDGKGLLTGGGLMPAQRFLILLPALSLAMAFSGAGAAPQETGAASPPPPATSFVHHASALMGVSVTVVDERAIAPPPPPPQPRPAPARPKAQGR